MARTTNTATYKALSDLYFNEIVGPQPVGDVRAGQTLELPPEHPVTLAYLQTGAIMAVSPEP